MVILNTYRLQGSNSTILTSFLTYQSETIIRSNPSSRIYWIFTFGSKQKSGLEHEYTLSKQVRRWVSSYLINATATGWVTAFTRTANWLRYYKIYNKDIAMFIDSSSSVLVKSLKDVYTTLNLVHEYRTSLNEMVTHSNIALHWMRGYGSSDGNIITDRLTPNGQT